MGLFDNLTGGAAGAGGDWQKQAEEAQKMAQQAAKDAGYGDAQGNITMANSAEATAAMGADRSAMEAQTQEQNRILTVGSPASLTIVGKTDTGEKVAGNPVYVLEIDVTPEGGATYRVDKREIIPATTIASYADGAGFPGRVDPADPMKIAFGDKPFM